MPERNLSASLTAPLKLLIPSVDAMDASYGSLCGLLVSVVPLPHRLSEFILRPPFKYWPPHAPCLLAHPHSLISTSLIFHPIAFYLSSPMLQLIPGEQGRVEFYPSHAESLVRLKDRPTASMRQRRLMACEFVKPQDGEGTVNGLGWTRRQVRRESNILPGWDEVAFPDLQGTGAKSITVKLWVRLSLLSPHQLVSLVLSCPLLV